MSKNHWKQRLYGMPPTQFVEWYNDTDWEEYYKLEVKKLYIVNQHKLLKHKNWNPNYRWADIID